MPTHKVEIIQVYRVERRITVEVEAATPVKAVAKQDADCAPPYDDCRWTEERSLENEEVRQSYGGRDVVQEIVEEARDHAQTHSYAFATAGVATTAVCEAEMELDIELSREQRCAAIRRLREGT